MAADPPLILVAEDNPSDRMLLTALLRSQGYRVAEAADGAAALEQFTRSDPALILLDVMMPVLDGTEVARRIGALAEGRFVPIVFLTALQDPAELAACLDAGGIDFLTKPYQEVVLRAKISAFLRMGDMHAEVQRQRDEIQGHHERLLREQEVAKAVFDKVAHIGALELANVRYLVSPLAMFNGDVVLAARGPTDNLLALLGDFTGHGLAAAIGAMPLAETFYAMAAKGFRLRDIIREINGKLHGVLPAGVFCCATVVDFDFNEGMLHCWNGGLPEGVLLRADGGRRQRLRSRHLPLGILSRDRFDDRVDRFPVAPGDRLLVWSDGLLEAQNPAGEMFGDARLQKVLSTVSPDRCFDALQTGVKDFIGESNRVDDLSLLEVSAVSRRDLSGLASPPGTAARAEPQHWELRLELQPESLRGLNPLPLLLHILMEVPGLRPFSSALFTALSELYANALEHGVLGLDSQLKTTSAGFSRYYLERDRRLAQLDSGQVALLLHYRGDSRGGSLTIELADSGKGFDPLRLPQRLGELTGYAGRGLALVERLGFMLEFTEGGSRVQAMFRWGEAADEAGPAL